MDKFDFELEASALVDWWGGSAAKQKVRLLTALRAAHTAGVAAGREGMRDVERERDGARREVAELREDVIEYYICGFHPPGEVTRD